MIGGIYKISLSNVMHMFYGLGLGEVLVIVAVAVIIALIIGIKTGRMMGKEKKRG